MKAISPVIATVIIVAVAIAISIAVALWITGMTSSFTGVEKLEVVNAYAETGTDANGNTYWLVHVVVKNTGTKTATIDNIFINNKPGTITNAIADNQQIQNTGLQISTGQEKTLVFLLTSTGTAITAVTTSTESMDASTTLTYPSRIIGEPGSTINLKIILSGTSLPSPQVKIDDSGKWKSLTPTDTNTYETTTPFTLNSDIGIYSHTLYIDKDGDSKSDWDTTFTEIVIEPIITYTFSSGQTVSIIIHTASGGQYPATVTLP